MTVCLTLAALCVIGLGIWVGERRRFVRYFEREFTPRWLETSPAWKGAAVQLEAEWLAMDYRKLGTLQLASEEYLAVLTHPELPIYAGVYRRAEGKHGTGAAYAVALTFFPGTGRLLSTGAPYPEAAWEAAAGGSSPRLVQARVDARPVALDGQHCGTVRAWVAGKRQPLPTSREALLEQLVVDRDAQKTAVLRRGLSLLDALRILLRAPRGVLKF